jgi:hypothetical protein
MPRRRSAPNRGVESAAINERLGLYAEIFRGSTPWRLLFWNTRCFGRRLLSALRFLQ